MLGATLVSDLRSGLVGVRLTWHLRECGV